MLKADKIGLVAMFALVIVEIIWLAWPKKSKPPAALDTQQTDTYVAAAQQSATDADGVPVSGSRTTVAGAVRQVVGEGDRTKLAKSSVSIFVADLDDTIVVE
jgi:hypothetical protein